MGRPTLSPEARGYGTVHRAARSRIDELVAAGGVRCARGGDCRRAEQVGGRWVGGLILPGEPWDLGHVDGDRSRYSGPEHRACNRATAGRRPWQPPAPVELPPEPSGLDAADPRWSVPWLDELREFPPGAVWPRLMTVPHPRAVGSLGSEVIAWAERRSGKPLRWWQRLVVTRLLEIDEAGLLVWDALILSMARQLGKSWLLRELLLWRIHQGERFGEPQDVMHTGKDLAVCKEVQRPARIWAKARPSTYRVREVNGQEEIELLDDGSRWMLRAKEAVYGYSVSCAAADEAWKVRASSIEEGLTPTMAERVQPQLLLVSTAHRLATALMLGRRQAALVDLESGQGELLIEWSAPGACALDDRGAWRQASPHWTPQRERLISRQLQMLQAGEIDDPEEPEPEQSFRAQWLNQWPRTKTEVPTNTEPLLPSGLWTQLADEVASTGPIFVAVEDDFGMGAAVAAAAQLADGRIEVDGWLCSDWDAAVRDALRLASVRRVRKLQIGASMLSRMPSGTTPSPAPAGVRETRVGLALFRDLALSGMLTHHRDRTPELDEAIAQALVQERLTGLALVQRGPTHLVRAAVWAIACAHRPTPSPAIF